MDACPPPDPCRCPLCGGPNACAMAQPKGTGPQAVCWCVNATFSEALLARVPPPARRVACICAACVQASLAPA